MSFVNDEATRIYNILEEDEVYLDMSVLQQYVKACVANDWPLVSTWLTRLMDSDPFFLADMYNADPGLSQASIELGISPLDISRLVVDDFRVSRDHGIPGFPRLGGINFYITDGDVSELQETAAGDVVMSALRMVAVGKRLVDIRKAGIEIIRLSSLTSSTDLVALASAACHARLAATILNMWSPAPNWCTVLPETISSVIDTFIVNRTLPMRFPRLVSKSHLEYYLTTANAQVPGAISLIPEIP
jgi:hypothetical protein